MLPSSVAMWHPAQYLDPSTGLLSPEDVEEFRALWQQKIQAIDDPDIRDRLSKELTGSQAKFWLSGEELCKIAWATGYCENPAPMVLELSKRTGWKRG